MRNFVKRVTLALLGASSIALSAAAPATLTLAELRNNPERWPSSVTLPRDIAFQGGAAVKKGQSVKVVEIEGAEVVVDAGNGLIFGLPLAETDFVAQANGLWAKLTPEQREVTAATLANDRSLWPLKTKCSAEFRLANGATLKAGGEYEVRAVLRDSVELYSARHNATLETTLQSTDVVAQARALAAIPTEKRPSRVAAALRGKLVNVAGKPAEPEKLEDTQIFALYYGASWCGPCRSFSPGFVKFIERVTPENSRLTVLLLSNDKSDAQMLGYMADEKMPWLAMPLDKLMKTPLLTGYTKGGIPQLVIVDRQGKVLADSYRGTTYLGPKVAMDGLDKILATGVAK